MDSISIQIHKKLTLFLIEKAKSICRRHKDRRFWRLGVWGDTRRVIWDNAAPKRPEMETLI
jgi:hypothetical protein